MRLLVPVGWMPATEQGFAITLCTGEGAVSAWVDDKGEIHKGKPSEQTSHPCIFAGFGAAFDISTAIDTVGAPVLPAGILPPSAAFVVAVGQGLAAPPPPSTGPPVSL